VNGRPRPLAVTVNHPASRLWRQHRARLSHPDLGRSGQARAPAVKNRPNHQTWMPLTLGRVACWVLPGWLACPCQPVRRLRCGIPPRAVEQVGASMSEARSGFDTRDTRKDRLGLFPGGSCGSYGSRIPALLVRTCDGPPDSLGVVLGTVVTLPAMLLPMPCA
jgi:hypothetical protein